MKAPDSKMEPSVYKSLQALSPGTGEVPRGKLLAVYCGVGLRSYIASRILRQNGFSVANIPGGYKTYQQFLPQLRRKA